MSSSPLDSPLEIRWIIIGGNSRLWPSDLPIGAPSRTRIAASATAAFIGRLVTTSPEMRSASSTGTVLAVSVLSVRAKRAVFEPRTILPTSGRRSSRSCQRRRFDSTRSQRENSQAAEADADDQQQAVVAHEVAARDQRLRQQRQLGLAVAEHLHDLRHDRHQQEEHDRDAHHEQHHRVEHGAQRAAAQLLAVLGVVGQPLEHRVEVARLLAGRDGGAVELGEAVRKLAEAVGQRVALHDLGAHAEQ